jgi:choline transporter-like protein 2/4/5
MKYSSVDTYHDDDYFREGGDDGDDMKKKYEEDMNRFKVENAGINKDRGCTDILCLLILWAFIGAMGYATVYGYKNGNVHKLTAPIDAGKNFCGFGEMEGYPKMILMNFDLTGFASNPLNTGICLKKCPTESGKDFVEGTDCKGNDKVPCNDRKSYKTRDVFDFCFPTSKDALDANEVKGYDYLIKYLEESPVGSVYQDLYKSSTSVYISMGLALVWSFIFIYFMSWFAEYLAWCSVVLIQLGLLAATVYSYILWDKEKTKLATLRKEKGYDTMDEANKQVFDDKESWTAFYFLLLMIAMVTFCCCFFSAIWCAKDSLKRAIDVIDASADFIARNKCVILIPNFHYFLVICFAVVWIGAFLCVVSLNDIKVDSTIPQGRDIIWDKKVFYASLFMFFGYLWISACIEYLSRFVVIMSACTYYFNNHRDKPDEENPPDVGYSFKCGYLNHMGSIAFGAFIIAFIRFIKFIFYNMAKKLQSLGGPEGEESNGCINCLVGCGACILNCIEKICDYLNEAAYCYMAVTGDHFLSSAWNAFLLNLKHGMKFAFANTIAKMFIFIGKIGIVVANCFSLYFIMKFRKDLDEVNTMWAPIIIVAIVTYYAASLFLSLFEEAVMSLLTCLSFDMETHGGEPVFGPATFHDNYVAKASGGKDVAESNEMN